MNISRIIYFRYLIDGELKNHMKYAFFVSFQIIIFFNLNPLYANTRFLNVLIKILILTSHWSAYNSAIIMRSTASKTTPTDNLYRACVCVCVCVCVISSKPVSKNSEKNFPFSDWHRSGDVRSVVIDAMRFFDYTTRVQCNIMIIIIITTLESYPFLSLMIPLLSFSFYIHCTFSLQYHNIFNIISYFIYSINLI